jgi:NAD(P)-dependent dehydrogenase (short-subunit alcohol dehydrogenase family)
LIFAGRNVNKIQECIDLLKQDYPNVDYRALKIDLSSQSSVRTAAAEILTWSDVPAIDIVVNNAGVMCVPERRLTVDGLEMHFATNHIGHWLLTCLIMPKMIKSAEGKPQGTTRIVNVSSLSPTIATMRWSDINFDKPNKELPEVEQPPYEMLEAWGFSDCRERSYIPLDGYNRSKVANVLFGIGATKRLYEKYGIFSLAVHPGIIQTELGRDFDEKQLSALAGMRTKGVFTHQSLGAGASTSLVAALDPKLKPGETVNGRENHGSYLVDCQISDSANPLAVSSNEAERLWALSEDLVKEKFSW